MFTPSHLISQFDLQSGSQVVDMGAGGGELTMALARAVGEAGRVYAVEVQKGLLERIKNLARHEHLHTVEAIWGDIERVGGTHLKEGLADGVVVSNVLFQVESKEGLLSEIRRILKPQGRVFLIEWSESFGGLGPHADEVVSSESARKLFENFGFRFIKSLNAGVHHYGMVFKKL